MNMEGIELFGNPLINFAGLGELLLRFAIDFVVIYIIVGLIFYPRHRQRIYLFSYFLINVSVFFVCILLNSMQLQIGFAFGLFAVFAIIRYRTEPIPITEMTYLFVTIIVSVINALAVKTISYAELLVSNAVIVLSVFVLEMYLFKQGDMVKKIRYEKIELIRPGQRREMMKDLAERTGLNITKVEIQDIDFLNDTVTLKVFYRES